MCKKLFPMYFFESGDLKIQLSWSLNGVNRDDTFIIDGDQECVKWFLPFVLKDKVKKVPPLGGG